jgi:hypothetical protein
MPLHAHHLSIMADVIDCLSIGGGPHFGGGKVLNDLVDVGTHGRRGAMDVLVGSNLPIGRTHSRKLAFEVKYGEVGQQHG